MTDEDILKLFERNGMRIEFGAKFSARGQVAQLLNGCQELVRKYETELSRYSMSAGAADQYKWEALAARAALGFSSDAEDVSPSDIKAEILRLQST